MIDSFHDKFYKRYNRYGRCVNTSYNDEDYHEFTTNELEWLRAHCHLIKPILKKGDMLLWCSCIPHAAASSTECTEDVNMRIGTFISMFPQKMVSQHHLYERKRLAKQNLTSSHNILYPKLFYFSNYDEPSCNLPIYPSHIRIAREKLIS
jgi:hypothetical protein